MRDALRGNGRVALASTGVLSVGFAATGFATAVLGATLPVMLARWSLSDRQGGVLFLLLFLGSSLGALLSRGRPAFSVARGLGLLTPACVALPFASGGAVFPVCFCYGLGLGITITSISLLRSQRCTTARAAEMNRLNLIWAAGAFSCPWVANEVVRTGGVKVLFVGLGALFACLLVWMAGVELRLLPPVPARAVSSRAGVRLPFVIALVTFFAVGLESAMGAWIATYAERLRSGFEAPVAAASVFWFGLLASRALHSTRITVGRFSEDTLMRAGAAVAAVGCGFLLGSGGQTGLLAAGFLIGFGVGPVYPLLLAVVLPRIAGNTIFLMAGMGGAVFPLVIGAVSTRAGSLRVGMAVPAVVGLVMLVLVQRVAKVLAAVEAKG